MLGEQFAGFDAEHEPLCMVEVGRLMAGPVPPMMHKISMEKKKEDATAASSRGFSVSRTVGEMGRWSIKRLGEHDVAHDKRILGSLLVMAGGV
jgi:hypothetical protein